MKRRSQNPSSSGRKIQKMETILSVDPHAPEAIAEQQAERSGITCCQDEMIRGGLIQSITDPDILEDLKKIKDPRSSSSGLTMDQEVEEEDSEDVEEGIWSTGEAEEEVTEDSDRGEDEEMDDLMIVALIDPGAGRLVQAAEEDVTRGAPNTTALIPQRQVYPMEYPTACDASLEIGPTFDRKEIRNVSLQAIYEAVEEFTSIDLGMALSIRLLRVARDLKEIVKEGKVQKRRRSLD